MTNTFTVCLLTISLFYCTSLSTARQVPKECVKGPKYWCETLKNAAACGAVGHCTTTVWEMEVTDVKSNIVSDKIVQRFSQLKDVKTMINEDYLSSSVSSSCRDAVPGASRLCLDNTDRLAAYLMHVLQSDTSPQTMCKIIQMCNNPQLDGFISKKESEEPSKETPLLGASRCTWGPSYWCSNFSTGRECSATRHCAQRVWARRHYQDDNDSICKICKDMVAQARDQLQSNQTQEELKEVFEGECALIPIKVVRRECDRLADEFVPELVETLTSQMNPAAVCSVAGLCNSERIDRLIEDYNATLELRKGCSNCRRSVGVVRKRFDETDYEDFLVGLLKVCREMGSLSDSCSMLTFKYYENILAAVRKDFTPHDVCHLSGQCAHNYHEHDLYTFPDEKQDLKATDDVPCEFCEQVVKHLRDTMVANTTELEFQKILRGLCKQTGSFKSECLSLVEQYYGTIYNFLVSELNASAVCGFIGICSDRSDADVAPLLPPGLEVKSIAMSKALIGADEANSYTTHKPSKQENVQILRAVDAQLPIERMFVQAPPSPKDDNIVCSFCQYFLHYIQVELSDDNTEEAIKKVVENACDVLPESINNTCREFVSQYGPAVIALLVQEIDPASVCPALGLCAKTEEVRRVSINSDKSNCPLCLFAVEQLETVLKNNKSEASIRRALSGLCSHLSAKLRSQCVDFVNAYSDELVEMLVADLNAQEICVYLKLCKDDSKHTDPLRISDQIDKYHDRPHLRGDRNNRRRPVLPRHMLEPGAGDIETNEIPDNTVNGRPVDSQGSACVICEFVLKEIDDSIKDKHNDDEIKKVVHNICKRMPKSVRSECDQFVEKYSDLVISLLAQELDPDEVCRELKLCKATGLKAVKEEILECAVCETLVLALEKILTNKKVDDSIIHIAEEACGLLPGKYNRRCSMLMEVYGAGLIKIIEQYGVRGACARAGLCAARDRGAGAVTIMGDSN